MENENKVEVVRICPTESELSEIITNIKCTEPNCTSVFLNSSNLEMHLIKTHSKHSDFLNKKDLNCNFQFFCPIKSCKYQMNNDNCIQQLRWFSKHKYLKQHYLRVHKERKFECASCHKLFLTEKERNYHSESECGNKFSCLSCTAMYNTSLGLWAHCKRKNHMHLSPRPSKICKNLCNVNLCIVQNQQNDFKDTFKGTSILKRELPILPKPVSNPIENIAAAALSELSWKIVVRGIDKEVQTINRKKTPVRSLKKRDSQETQTGDKKPKISQETQTTSSYKNRCSAGPKLGTQTQTLQDLFAELSRSPQSPLSDVILPQLYTSSTQTAHDNFGLDLDIFEEDNHSQQSIDDQFDRLIQSSLFVGSKSCTTETQTELDITDNFIEPILSNTETQTNLLTSTSSSFDEYSNNYTQTCDIFLNDFVEFSDIETQTAWASLTVDPALVSAQTQTLF